MVRALAVRHPVVPLFRNSRNGGWGSSTIHTRVRKCRRQLGLACDVVPYLTRHAFANHHLEDGPDLVVVAKLMGHAVTNTLQDV
jgi:site-specific recombinase XerD